MRTIQRVARRAELPAEYSKGFNPHMSLSIAQPLSVGMYSEGEYMDLILTEALDAGFVLDKLNENAPSGVRFIKAVQIPEGEDKKKVPQSMALIEAAQYEITIKYSSTIGLKEELNSLNSKESWETLKKSKSGEKLVDIKPMVKDIDYKIQDSKLIISCIVACGSRENLSADLLAQYIKANTESAEAEAFIDIKRVELYYYEDLKLVPLYNCR
jgi:radical SAM-linked protein